MEERGAGCCRRAAVVRRALGAAGAAALLLALAGARPGSCWPVPVEGVDRDGDGVADVEDTCPAVADPDQADWDGDGVGDACSLGWRAATLVRDATGATVSDPAVAVASDGTAFVVWADTAAGATWILARRFTAGAWTDVEQVARASGPLGPWHAGPDLAVEADGDATAVWLAGEPPQRRVEAARFSATAGRWEPAAPLSVSGVDAGEPAVGAGGDATVVAWAAGGALWATRAASTGWAAPRTVSADRVYPRRPAVGVDAAGVATVAWCASTAGPGDQAFVARSEGDGWGAAVSVSPAPTSFPNLCERPAVAVAPSGDALVTYTWWLPSYRPDFSLRLAAWDAAADRWSPPEGLEIAAARDGEGVSDVALNDAGVGQVTWVTGDGSYVALATLRCEGTSCAGAAEFETSARGPSRTSVGIDACGRALGAWTAAESPLVAAQAVVGGATDDEGGWAEPVVLRAPSDDDPYPGSPAVATNAAGRGVAAWRDAAGVHAARHVSGCLP